MRPSPDSISPPASPRLRRAALTSAVVLAATLTLSNALTAPLAQARGKQARVAAVTLTNVKVTSTAGDARLTVAGRVRLPVNTASERRHTEVYLILTGGAGKTAKTETFTAKLTSKDAFIVVHTTNLTGALGLGALVKIAGRQSGKRVVKTIEVAGVPTTGAQPSGTTSSPSTAGSSTGATTTGTPLIGTFEIQAGAQAQSGAISGSYFQMLTPPDHITALANPNSTALDNTYTLLSPGTAGGLSTAAFQPPPNPAFGYAPGAPDPGAANSLASAIIQPVPFFDVDFSIATQAEDLESGQVPPAATDSLPAIVDTDGALSGQLTAWSAGWSDDWFNQGTPKPDGTLPDGTTQLTGTYDAVTGRYTLHWISLIVGGEFNSFAGSWQLEGTFIPAP